MPFNGTTKLVEAIWAFVDQYFPGDNAMRSGFDQYQNDLIAAINAQSAYVQSLIGSTLDARYLGRKATVPTLRNDASALQAGDWYVSSAAPAGRINVAYIFDGSVFVAVSDFSAVSALGQGLAAAENATVARGLLGLGSAAVQNDTAFAPASVASDVLLALKLADSAGLAKPVSGADWNSAHSTGPGTAFLQGNAATLNGPVVANLSGVYVAYDANNGFLLLTAHGTGAMYSRARFAGAWQAWRSMFSVDTATLLDGDIFYASGGNLVRLPKGSALQRLRMNSSGLLPEWATEPFVRAQANFSGISTSGTYSRAGNTVTSTITAHGMTTGEWVQLDFTTGTATDGWYTVTVVDANTFTVTDAASGSTSGNVTRTIWARAIYNISNITRAGAGDYTLTFTTPMPDRGYVVNGVGSDGIPDTTFRSINLGPFANMLTTSVRILMKGVNAAAQALEDSAVITVSITR